jgi:hypothetical protein
MLGHSCLGDAQVLGKLDNVFRRPGRDGTFQIQTIQSFIAHRIIPFAKLQLVFCTKSSAVFKTRWGILPVVLIIVKQLFSLDPIKKNDILCPTMASVIHFGLLTISSFKKFRNENGTQKIPRL